MQNLSRKEPEEEVKEKGETMLLGISLYSLAYALVCLVSPTKDPKFLVIGLPAIVMSAASVVVWVMNYLKTSKIPPLVSKAGKIILGLTFFLVAFPVDLLGLDNTRFKKLYPTDHAYTNVALPHGQDYLPIAERIFEETGPGEVIPVGRQGPIIGYLTDRPYQILYTENDPGAFEERLQTSRYLVIDDTWENCFAGISSDEVGAIRKKVEGEYAVVEEVGHVKLWVRK